MLEKQSRWREYTSWRIGGPALLRECRHSRELQEALRWANSRAVPVFVLGGGTNVLARDAGFDGLVLRYGPRRVRLPRSPTTAASGSPPARRPPVRCGGWPGRAGGGLQWAEVCGHDRRRGVRQRGCYGSDIASALARAWLLVDGELQEWPVGGWAMATGPARSAKR
jgi:UDP-N-acetylmuramate dehydrogenase